MARAPELKAAKAAAKASAALAFAKQQANANMADLDENLQKQIKKATPGDPALRQRMSEELRGSMTWYEASRHSFASRNLDAGVPLEEVSGVLGHASPATTLRHYSRFIRKDYSEAIRRGLKLVPDEGAKVPPFTQAGSSGK